MNSISGKSSSIKRALEELPVPLRVPVRAVETGHSMVTASVAAAAVVLVPELAEPVAFFAANAVISALEVAIVVALAAVVQVLASLLHTAPDVVALILSIVEFVAQPFDADDDIHRKEGDDCTLVGV